MMKKFKEEMNLNLMVGTVVAGLSVIILCALDLL